MCSRAFFVSEDFSAVFFVDSATADCLSRLHLHLDTLHMPIQKDVHASVARVKTKACFIAMLAMMLMPPSSFADGINGKNIFLQRCAMCHGADIKGTGPLANKSTPPTPDLTTPAFKKRLVDYPGVIVSSVILRPNGDLIPRTLRENGVKLPAFAWTVKDFRDLNEYMTGVIKKTK